MEDIKKKHRGDLERLKSENSALEAKLRESNGKIEQLSSKSCNCNKEPAKRSMKAEFKENIERPSSALRGIRIEQPFSHFKNPKRTRQSIRRPLSSQANKS